MSRVKSDNYGSIGTGLDGATEFYWATQGNDSFSREQDMASMARALDGHDHTHGKGLAVAGYAAGSIPASAIVPNPIFPGMVTINSGLNITGGGAAITGDVNISGFMWAHDDVRSTNGHILAPAGHGIFHTGLTVDTGGATIGGTTGITGDTTITGNLNIAGAGSTITQAGTGAVHFGGTVTIGGGLGVSSTISNSAGGLTIAGNSSISGFLVVTGNLSSGGTLMSASTLTVSAGGCQIFGTADLWGTTTTVHGNLGIGGSCGVTGVLQPASDGGANLGVDIVNRWNTLYALHTVISSTSSFAGLLTCAAGLTVTAAAATNVQDLTVHGNISANSATSSFAMIQPVPTNNYSCGNSSLLWTAVYATGGVIMVSSEKMKEHITELDPELALKVALDTKIHEFQYRSSDEDGNLQSRKTAKPRRERQVGFMAEKTHPLLMAGEDFVNPQTTASVALAAIQALSAKIEALTARLAELEGPVH